MPRAVLGSDRVMLLLSLVPYLTEHGPTTVTELAEAFDISPELLRKLVTILGTAGVPGETLTYQDEDLFDIDWDAFLENDLVSLTRVVVVDEAPRFAPSETAALIAGLHALTGVLPGETAELARATAAKLGAALGDSGRCAALTVTADPEDPQVPVVVAAIDEGRTLAFEYRDASGTRTSRTVDPISMAQDGGSWYLRAYCHDREAARTFRLDHMSELRVTDTRGLSEALVSHRLRELAAPRALGEHRRADEHRRAGEIAASFETTFPLTVELPARLLSQIQGFSPEIVEELDDHRVLVTVEAWHERAAIQLVQIAPGQIVVRSPAKARAAVRAWTARALSAYDA